MNVSQIYSLASLSQTSPTQSPTNPLKPSGVGESKPQSGAGFGELLSNFVEQTNATQRSADNQIQDFATGKSDNVQQVVLAMAKADMSFQVFMEVRNKVVDAYNELMRLQF